MIKASNEDIRTALLPNAHGDAETEGYWLHKPPAGKQDA